MGFNIFLLKLIIPYNQLPKQPEIWAQVTIPSEFQPIGKYNIGFTALIETNICDPSWIEGMNRMNLGIVTSTFVKKVFEGADYVKQLQDGRQEQLKCNKPIEVCFWGANTDFYKKTNEKVQTVDDVLNKIPETFAFLFVGQWTHGGTYNDRKDIGNLVKTFCNAFKNKENKPATTYR